MTHLLQNAVRIVASDTYMVSTTDFDLSTTNVGDVVLTISGGLSWAQRDPVIPYTNLLEKGIVEEWSLTTEDPFDRLLAKTLYLVRGAWRPISTLDDADLDRACMHGDPNQKVVASYWRGFHKARQEGCGCR